jgi:hypothetical protein
VLTRKLRIGLVTSRFRPRERSARDEEETFVGCGAAGGSFLSVEALLLRFRGVSASSVRRGVTGEVVYEPLYVVDELREMVLPLLGPSGEGVYP